MLATEDIKGGKADVGMAADDASEEVEQDQLDFVTRRSAPSWNHFIWYSATASKGSMKSAHT